VVKRRDEFRVLAVIRTPRDGELDGGSSTVDRRLVEVTWRRKKDERAARKTKGGSK
jgi:hypothetical protein